MNRHLLIASATWKYLDPRDDRPVLPQVLQDVVRLFTTTIGAYSRELVQIGQNPKSSELTTSLDHWFGDPARDSSDWVVLYYTGHAEILESNALYLLTSDFVDGQHVSTAFDFQKLADIILSPATGGRSRQVRNLLVILDTCFAGKGVADLASRLSIAFRRSSGGSFYLLGAALQRQEAQAGALAKALIAAVEDLSTRYLTQEYLYLDQIVPTINQHLRKAGVQDAIRTVVDSPIEIPQFFPNRSFLNTNGKPVTTNIAQRAISDQEFRAHWGPRARGVEFDNQSGFFFSGRKSVLETLTTYLNDPARSKALVLTGSPGSGKSAILSRLVNLSVPELRAKWPSHDLGPEIPPFDFALHAKGKTVNEVVSRLSDVLGVSPSERAILTAATVSRRQIRLVVDALDEAADPQRLATELLRPLAALDAVKLIVGTRSAEISSIGDAEIIDIDGPENARKEDLASYVTMRLSQTNESGRQNPYIGQDTLISRVAAAVAEKAYPNFLVARLIVESLRSQANPVDPRSITFPDTVPKAFDLYLSRFGENEKSVRDLLLPLAYAQGQGLPWDDIWAPLASALSKREASGHQYSDDDIRWVLQEAGAFILETTEGERSVYRLFHQALAETLWVGEDFVRVQSSITTTLTTTVPDRNTTAEEGTVRTKNWLLANRYVRYYLAAHADAIGGLQQYLDDPLFLIAADPSQLLTVVGASTQKLSRRILGSYRDVVHHVQGQPASISGAYLELVARKRGLGQFADRISSLPLDRAWEVPWARWAPPAASRSLAQGDGLISCLETATLRDGRIVALVGRRSGNIEVWEIKSGKRLRQWVMVAEDWVKHLVIARLEQHDFIVASSSDGQLGIFDLLSDQQAIRRDPPDPSESEKITALCITEHEGRTICITAHGDDHLSAWEMPTLRLILEKKKSGAIYDLHVIEKDGKPLLLGAGDTMGDSSEVPEGIDWKMSSQNISALRMLSLADFSVIWEDGTGRGGYFDHISQVRLFDRELAAGYRNGQQEFEIWDLDERREVCTLPIKASQAWLHRVAKDPILTWEWCGEFRATRLVSGTKDGQFHIEAKSDGEPVAIQGDQFSEITTDQNRAVILSAVLDHVRVWDFEDLLRESLHEREPEDTEVQATSPLHVSALGNDPQRADEFYVGSWNKIFAMDSSNGRTLWERELASSGAIKQIRVLSSRRMIVVADSEGSIHLLDAIENGISRQVIRTGFRIEAMELASWRGKSVAIVTAEDRRSWSTRIWDLETGNELPTSGEYGLSGGQEDKTLRALAVFPNDQSIRVAFAGQYGKVMVGDFDGTPIRIQRTRHFIQEWHMPTAPCYTNRLAAAIIGNEVLLTAGNEEGDLAVWNFRTGRLRNYLKGAHIGCVNALTFKPSPDRVTFLSAGVDGVLRFWTDQLEEVFSIETGEPVSHASWLSDDIVVVGGAGGVLTMKLSGQALASNNKQG